MPLIIFCMCVCTNLLVCCARDEMQYMNVRCVFSLGVRKDTVSLCNWRHICIEHLFSAVFSQTHIWSDGNSFIPGSVFRFQHGPQPWKGKTTQPYRNSICPRGFSQPETDSCYYCSRGVVLSLLTPRSLLIPLHFPSVPWHKLLWSNVRNRSQSHHLTFPYQSPPPLSIDPVSSAVN